MVPLAPQDKDIASILMSLSSNSAPPAPSASSAAAIAAAIPPLSSGGVTTGNGRGGLYPSASDASEASILSQFKSSVVRDIDFTSTTPGKNGSKAGGAMGAAAAAAAAALGDDDDDEGDDESTNGDELGNGAKRVKVEYSTTDPEARRKERNRIHAQKARLRKKTLLRDMKIVSELLLLDWLF